MITAPAVAVAERGVAAAVGLALVVATLVWAVRLRRAGRQPIEPLTIFLLGWGFELVLFSLPVIDYIDSSAKAWIAVYGSIVTFTAGAVAVYRLVPARGGLGSEPERLSPRRIRLVWGGALALGLVGFAMYVRAVDAVLGWQDLFDNPSVVRGIQTTSTKFDDVYGKWRLLTYFGQIAFLVWTIGLREGAFSGRWRLAAPLGLLSIVPFYFTGERTLLGTLLVWTLFFHLVWKPVRSWRRLAVVGTFAFVVLATVFAVLGGRVGKTIEFHPEIESVLTAEVARGQALEYVYVTGNIPTLSRLMQDPIAPRTHGAMTLLPGVKLLHAATGLGNEPPEEVGAFYPIPFDTFNNYSWLGSFFLDFGLAGCLLLPALFGALATLVARLAASRQTVLSAWTLSLTLYVVAFTPLLNKLSTTLTWQYLLVGPVVATLLRERGRVHLPEWARSRKRLLAAGAAAAIGLLGLATTVATSNPPPASGGAELEARLSRAAARAATVTRSTRSLTSLALASRLHVADPGMRYEGLADYRSVPDSTAAIGVFVGGRDDLWLWGKAVDGTLRGAHVVLRGPRSGTYLLDGPSRSLLVNGDLEQPFVAPWQVSPSRVAEVASDPALSWASDSSLRIRGRGRRGRQSTFIAQIVKKLPDRSVGATYTMRMQAYTRNLSRPLPAAMKFNYRDGSADFFPVVAGTAGVPGGEDAPIPQDTDKLWQVGTAIARARKPLGSIQVFIVDTGLRRLRGSVWIDGVSLTAGAGLAGFSQPF